MCPHTNIRSLQKVQLHTQKDRSTNSMGMMCRVLLLAVVTVLEVQAQRTFQDDLGKTFTTSKAKPTIVTDARTALSLHHIGFDADQIVGLYGLLTVRGSPVDVDSPEPSPFVIDPTADELLWLKSIQNLSPGCSQTTQEACYYGGSFNLTVFKDELAVLQPDFLVTIDNGLAFQELKGLGFPEVYLDSWYEYDATGGCRDLNNATILDPARCTRRSMIEVIERKMEFAEFMGHPDTQIAAERQALCDAAADFTDAAEDAHSRGVRALPVIYGIFGPGLGVMTPFDLFEDSPLRTMEELGMPFVQAFDVDCSASSTTGRCSTIVPDGFGSGPNGLATFLDWFPQCTQELFDEQNTAACTTTEVTFPADVLFLWTFTYSPAIVTQDAIASTFPHPALVDGQYTWFFRNDAALSYRNAARMLVDAAALLRRSQPLYPQTDCVDVDVASGNFLSQATRLPANTYACFDRNNLDAKYTGCPVPSAPTPPASPTSPASPGSVEPPTSSAAFVIGNVASRMIVLASTSVLTTALF